MNSDRVPISSLSDKELIELHETLLRIESSIGMAPTPEPAWTPSVEAVAPDIDLTEVIEEMNRRGLLREDTT